MQRCNGAKVQWYKGTEVLKVISYNYHNDTSKQIKKLIISQNIKKLTSLVRLLKYVLSLSSSLNISRFSQIGDLGDS